MRPEICYRVAGGYVVTGLLLFVAVFVVLVVVVFVVVVDVETLESLDVAVFPELVFVVTDPGACTY